MCCCLLNKENKNKCFRDEKYFLVTREKKRKWFNCFLLDCLLCCMGDGTIFFCGAKTEKERIYQLFLYHSLLVGEERSFRTNYMYETIVSLALWWSCSELSVYGVEFKCCSLLDWNFRICLKGCLFVSLSIYSVFRGAFAFCHTC
jgi:hypothetical protein